MTVQELDALLGDPYAPANPVGHKAVLAADEHHEMLAEGERLLDQYNLNAEFVPTALGGRLERADRLVEVLRAVWRRDPCLGLGYGFSSFIAAVNIWSTGDQDQTRTAARLLLDNHKIAAAFHELDHGNDFAHADFTARPAPAGWLLSGRKEVVTNLRRSSALVLFARTSDAPGSRGHSQFFVQKDTLPSGRMRDLPRFDTSGMHGVQLGGAEFTACPVPDTALLGKPGQGIEIALRSYQLTRATVPAICVGPLDSALRIVLTFALERRLYGGTVADIPYVRAVIARAYADLLAVDAYSAAGVRALHLLPESMAVYAPAAKYLTSRIVIDAFEDLRSVLGAQAYLRTGPHAIFQKLARDIAPATFAHVSRAACLVTILPQLPRLARRSWLTDPPAPDTLFQLGGDLPPLHLDRLAAGMTRNDGIMGALAAAEPDSGPVGRFTAHFQQALRALQTACAGLRPSDITIDASPEAFDLADRYTVLLAAASALAVWQQGGDTYPEPALLGVLDRLAGRLGGAPVLTGAEREHAEDHLFHLAVQRCQDRRLFDLTARAIPG
ncbi:acyl-CoA dehydrogenase [Streptomyces sp. RLB1-33]|uniref:acyl-CoA dehydrogenase n=1 Tax=Streptomyces mirabilis TaxID=68239 RepID=UPI00143E8CD8|nr:MULTISPECIES: acyl-CoA dehydrogenase [Streptomyces]QIY68651.1 acyl-CoA dehydrogenase [Streptomyces sp. RLB1-33]QUW84584.1 acyl-CoA dehydrogenase [Streptomyces mirabilis]